MCQDIISHLIALAQAEDKGVRLRVCQLLQSIMHNQVPLQMWRGPHAGCPSSARTVRVGTPFPMSYFVAAAHFVHATGTYRQRAQ